MPDVPPGRDCLSDSLPFEIDHWVTTLSGPAEHRT